MASTPESRRERVDLLKKRLRERVLVLDGATGTALQDENLTTADFGGEAYEGCNENLVFTRPDVVKRISQKYLEAGADIVETNTFGATPLVLGEYGLSHKAFEINKIACELAREACQEYSTPDWPRFVAGSIGPTTKSISVTGGISFDELSEQRGNAALAMLSLAQVYERRGDDERALRDRRTARRGPPRPGGWPWPRTGSARPAPAWRWSVTVARSTQP